MSLNGWLDPSKMPQLPIFLNLNGQPVILLGEGDSADAKRRLIERGGGQCVGEGDGQARIAFVAIEDEAQAIQAAERLKARGLLVNVVDRPVHCDFTTPAIVDRSPLLIAIGTGGASAGLAKAVRQRLEQILPQQLGELADALLSSRTSLKARFPDGADRRRAIDAALHEGGILDPLGAPSAKAVSTWLESAEAIDSNRVEPILLRSGDPEELTLKQARLLGQADTIVHDANVPLQVLARARADANRIMGPMPDVMLPGLTLHVTMKATS
jgi:uroporphyrin-III C-methyltransferase/precorrin-2 dehydrogenase/sirohydrochlorin ferrochelatase